MHGSAKRSSLPPDVALALVAVAIVVERTGCWVVAAVVQSAALFELMKLIRFIIIYETYRLILRSFFFLELLFSSPCNIFDHHTLIPISYNLYAPEPFLTTSSGVMAHY